MLLMTGKAAATDTSVFGEVAMVIAMVAFLAVVAYTFLRRHKDAHERARHLPFDNDDRGGETR